MYKNIPTEQTLTMHDERYKIDRDQFNSFEYFLRYSNFRYRLAAIVTRFREFLMKLFRSQDQICFYLYFCFTILFTVKNDIKKCRITSRCRILWRIEKVVLPYLVRRLRGLRNGYQHDAFPLKPIVAQLPNVLPWNDSSFNC